LDRGGLKCSQLSILRAERRKRRYFIWPLRHRRRQKCNAIGIYANGGINIYVCLYTDVRGHADTCENFQHRLKNVNGIYAKLCSSNFERRAQIFYAYAELTLPIRRVCRQRKLQLQNFSSPFSMPATQAETH